jgi:hypothetical protein
VKNSDDGDDDDDDDNDDDNDNGDDNEGGDGTIMIQNCLQQIWTIYSLYLFIHLVVCLTTGPKPLPKRALHIVRSRASSFK